MILENATVRAAAVSTLARFGAAVEALRPRVAVLLRRALFDGDDEVRDRAALALAQLGGELGGPEALLAAAERRVSFFCVRFQLLSLAICRPRLGVDVSKRRGAQEATRGRFPCRQILTFCTRLHS